MNNVSNINNMNSEILWDKKLKIVTSGRDDYHEDAYHYPYEPTPYAVLQRLAQSGYITRQSHIVDYGCGKGRVSFFLNNQIGCSVTGIEYDERMFHLVDENQKQYGKVHSGGNNKNSNLVFLCANAEEYEIENEDSFYFFNPFSIEILQSVLGKILDSYYKNPRKMRLFFYYPNDEYISCLMTMDELQFLDEIDCQDLFEGENHRERILIFEVGW